MSLETIFEGKELKREQISGDLSESCGNGLCSFFFEGPCDLISGPSLISYKYRVHF